MMAFAVKGDPDTQNRFVANAALITSAVSLGHDESLIVHVGTKGPLGRTTRSRSGKWGHLRFSVGLEDTEDLLADLTHALDATFGSSNVSGEIVELPVPSVGKEPAGKRWSAIPTPR